MPSTCLKGANGLLDVNGNYVNICLASTFSLAICVLLNLHNFHWLKKCRNEQGSTHTGQGWLFSTTTKPSFITTNVGNATWCAQRLCNKGSLLALTNFYSDQSLWSWAYMYIILLLIALLMMYMYVSCFILQSPQLPCWDWMLCLSPPLPSHPWPLTCTACCWMTFTFGPLDRTSFALTSPIFLKGWALRQSVLLQSTTTTQTRLKVAWIHYSVGNQPSMGAIN